MKLVSIALQNYRSITKTERIGLDSFTVLVGPNNEGKSNILLGLVTGMNLLSIYAPRASPVQSPTGTPRTVGPAREAVYRVAVNRGFFIWERDIPVSLIKSATCRSIFDFEFELDAVEVADFKREVGSNLNGRLPVRLTVSPRQIDFEVKKRGPGAKTLTSKASRIARFVGRRINVQNIPSVRTASDAVDLVRRMVEAELRQLEETDDYREAVERIAALQQPVLTSLGDVLSTSLRRFLPSLESVHVSVSDRYSALRRDCQVVIDDGTATELRYKGDGVQSLAAMSLIHHLSQQGTTSSSSLVLAIEEPEAHLHPDAIHALRPVLNEIALSQQVVITTHSPLFVNRSRVESNVVVNRNRARPAVSIREIREVLGVRVSDNLIAASLVLLVEGESDQAGISAVLRKRSAKVVRAIDNGVLVVDYLRGAGNLSYQVGLLKNQLCAVHVFLDNDVAGTQAAKRALDANLLVPAEVTYAAAAGMKESEVEDLYRPSLYASTLVDSYSITFPTRMFDRRKRRWSERMRQVFEASGQSWDSDVEARVKKLVSSSVARTPDAAIAEESATVIRNLVAVVERKLQAHS